MTQDNVKKLTTQWNAVKLFNEWRFINVGWACSCVVSDDDKDERRPARMLNEFYFLTDPDVLIGYHYPFNSNWQLLPIDSSISLDRFFKLPIMGDRFFAMDLQPNEYTPRKYDKRIYTSHATIIRTPNE